MQARRGMWAPAPGQSGNRSARSPWYPIRDFDQLDVDMSVFFLSQNRLAYLAPVFDPWLSANGTHTAGYTPAQLATASRLLEAVTTTSVHSIPSSLGVSSLWAHNLVFGNTAPGLPDNQWQAEVLGWLQTVLAKLQADVLYLPV